MRLQEFGFAVRHARQQLGLTQQALAKSAGVSRTTLNQLENGLFSNLSVNKLQSLLEKVGLTLALLPATKNKRKDPFEAACTTASISYKNPLTVDELIRGLLTGAIPAGKRPHFRTLLQEVPKILLQELVSEAKRWSEAGKVEKNLVKIADELGVSLNDN